MFEQILAALFVIGLLLVTVWILRRKGVAAVTPFWTRTGRSTNLEVLEKLPLTAQHSLHLVRVADQVILIGVSPSTCVEISTVTRRTNAAEMKAAT